MSDKLAKKITEQLFTSGAGQKAQRLVLEMPGGGDGGGWCEGAAEECVRSVIDSNTPEGCKLVAHDTGDGWYLGVEDSDGNEVAMLAWPSSWPEAISGKRLREFGFEVL